MQKLKLLTFNALVISVYMPVLVGESIFKWNRSHPILSDNTDVEILAAYVLIRGHIIIGPESEGADLDVNVLNKLVSHLYKVQQRHYSPAGPLLYPALEERDLGCDSLPNDAKSLCDAVTENCLAAEDMINMVPFRINYFHQALARLCPLMLFRQTRYVCRTFEAEDEDKPILVEPASEKVWAFGILFVTLSIVVSMGGLILLPFLTRENRRTILTLFEGLAVGGLAGSAILHLFPQAFGISDDDYRKYFWRTFLIFAGIYIFYIIERILKLVTAAGRMTRKRRASSIREDTLPLNLPVRKPLLSPQTMSLIKNEIAVASGASNTQACSCNGEVSSGTSEQEVRENEILGAIFNRQSIQADSPRSQIDQKLASIRQPITVMITSQDVGYTGSDVYSSEAGLDVETESIARSKQSYVHDIAGMRKDHYSNTRNIVDAVAWMIVLGDASLNFIDGLSIGAAFDRNILAGISISVAVMLEEVPHRLGTFAVLIRAGMDMKQSFLWIFISACALYPGLVLGIFLGDAAEEESPYIFAVAGGMFLYMALVDVLREMNRSMESAIRKGIRSSLQILALQNLGIMIAIICLSVLALYEKDMDFEAVEIRELQTNALQ